jgi:hypothetical protein
MPTNIVTIKNQADQSIFAFNSENVGNSFWTKPQSTTTTNGLWISWHQDQPLVLVTPRGACFVWDNNWEIHDQFEGASNEIIFLRGSENGVGGDIAVTVASSGEITMVKA